VVDYATVYADWNLISSLGGFVFGASQLVFVYLVFKTVREGLPAGNRAWDGARGLEWTLPSPPPYHSFETAPRLDGAGELAEVQT